MEPDNEVTYDESDPFFGEVDDEEELDLDIESVETLEASPEDVVDQHTPAYSADLLPPDEEID